MLFFARHKSPHVRISESEVLQKFLSAARQAKSGIELISPHRSTRKAQDARVALLSLAAVSGFRTRNQTSKQDKGELMTGSGGGEKE